MDKLLIMSNINMIIQRTKYMKMLSLCQRKYVLQKDYAFSQSVILYFLRHSFVILCNENIFCHNTKNLHSWNRINVTKRHGEVMGEKVISKTYGTLQLVILYIICNICSLCTKSI